MKRYFSERKAAILKQLLPRYSRSVVELARQKGVSDVTLCNYRANRCKRKVVCQKKVTPPDRRLAEVKVAAVAETLTMLEVELN